MRLLELKAEAFDRIVEKYGVLQADAGFYSKNWVELAEVIDDALQLLKRFS